MLAELMIHLPDKTVPVALVGRGGDVIVAQVGAIRQRIIREHLYTDRAELTGRNPVAREWSVLGLRSGAERILQHNGNPGIVYRPGEIAGPFQRAGHVAQVGFTPPKAVAFRTEHEERPVVAIVKSRYAERTQNSPSKLILMESQFRRVEVSAGVKFIIADILEQRAMELVRTRPHHHVDDAAGHLAVFGGIAGHLHLEPPS